MIIRKMQSIKLTKKQATYAFFLSVGQVVQHDPRSNSERVVLNVPFVEIQNLSESESTVAKA